MLRRTSAGRCQCRVRNAPFHPEELVARFGLGCQFAGASTLAGWGARGPVARGARRPERPAELSMVFIR